MCCERLLAQVPIPGIDASARTVHLDLQPTPTARAFLAEDERTSGPGLVLVGALSEQWAVAELDDEKPRNAR